MDEVWDLIGSVSESFPTYFSRVKILFCSTKNSTEVPDKLKSGGFHASRLSAYNFSTLYTTLLHYLIKKKLINLIEPTFHREGTLHLACDNKLHSLLQMTKNRFKPWSCQKVCDALIYLLDNSFIRFGTILHTQIVGILMSTYCAPLIADLLLFCYERDFMMSFSGNTQADVIEALNSTSKYLDGLLNIDNPYFEGMVSQMYSAELQLHKANTSDTEAALFLNLHLSILDGLVSSKIYDKRGDFDFTIVNFPFLDGDVPRTT